jgi:NADH-quinone oxidoreductase subunit M
MAFFDSLRNFDLISLITFWPLFGVLLILILREEQARLVALGISVGSLILTLKLVANFDPSFSGIQNEIRYEWIKPLEVYYHVGIDGLSVAMVLLVSIVALLTILATWSWVRFAEPNRAGTKPFFALILLELTGLYGAFTALNFFHWFIFWEATLVPMFFLIKLYGNEDRTHAAYQFFVYTFVGSIAMLLGMQFIYLATGSWDFRELAEMARSVAGQDSELFVKIKQHASILGVDFLTQNSVNFIFLLVLLGFAVKVPMWPLHTWLPISYTQAPTAGSMILTGLLSKMGVYGFLRIVLPLFSPCIQQYLTLLMVLAIATILFGALAAMVQRDLKTLIAYSSISHLGYCLLGVFAVSTVSGSLNDRSLALNGVIVQMFAHGLSAAGLFYFVGLLEQRSQTREIGDFGGLRKSAPVMTGLFGIVMFASLGLPGLAGFVGEFMIFRGAFPLQMGLTSIAVVGILLTALYVLRMTTKVYFGPQNEKWSAMPDLSGRETFVAAAFAVLLFLVGMVPAPLVNLSNATVKYLLSFLS